MRPGRRGGLVCEARVRLLGFPGDLLSGVGIVAGPLLGLEIVADHVVELLGQLEDSSKNVHLAAVDDSGVSTASTGAVFVIIADDLFPHVALSAPEIIELAVVVILASKNVLSVVVNYG